MKNFNTLPRNLLLRTVLILFAAVALLTTPQDALASVGKITFTSDAGSDNTYKLGDKIEATVTFNGEVNVESTKEKNPQLTLKIGTVDRKAAFDGRRSGNQLAFAYTVVAEDLDTDGIEIPANSLSLNGGEIINTITGKTTDLKHAALPAQTSHKVDGVVPTIAATKGIAITSTPTSNNTYKKDDKIQATVTFSENVNVTGTPQLTLKIGTADKKASYTSGNGTTALVFAYTVTAADTDTDGIEIEANKLALNSGTIKDLAGNAATLTHTALSAQASHKVDGAAPTIAKNGISITSTTAPYTAGEIIQATVTFSESVNVTGTPQLTLKIGTADKKASYTTGNGTANLVFEYTVVAGDTDTDGIEIAANKLTLNNGTIKDAAGNPATLTHTALTAQAAHKVDATVPTVAKDGIAITSTSNNSNTYKKGDKIQATVRFSENVNVTGTPQLTLKIGTADKKATYTKGTGLMSLIFEYTVAAGDTDTDGIEIEADSLTLNGGTIKDGTGNAGVLTHTALTAQASHKVDGTAPEIVATNGITITSTPTSNNTYKKGDKIQATVTFSESVNVKETPQLTLKIGTADKNASYTSGTGTAKLIFEYTVVAGDTDTDGIEIAANKLTLGTGTIKDAAGNPATLTHTALTAQAAHKVDGTVPTVATNGIAITSTAGDDATYKADDVIQATVTFSENVTVTGTPQLTLKIGTAAKTVDYTSGNGTTALVFEYTVATGDTDTDGIEIEADKLTRNGGTINDAAGNPATLTHTALTAQAAHKVDTTEPEIVATNGITITSTAGDDATYKADDVIQATVTFSENVTVTGTPQLTLKIGTAAKTVDYTSGDGTTALVFEYTVATGDTDTDGIEIEANKLIRNGGTINDAAGNPATLTYTALTAQAAHKVDTTAPEIAANGVKITSTTAHYTAGEVIQATVTFSENVSVTGTPQLALQIGNATKNADYTSGTDTTALVFEYTVVAGDTDADGISIAANALSLNNGTIKDATGNAATLTHTAVSADSAHQVDTTNPSVNKIAFTSTTAPYTVGEVVQATVTFSEKVFVTGTPQLSIQFSVNKKPAAYKSGNGTAALVFEYTVVAGETDADGISIDADSLTLNGGTIKDAVGNNANLTHTAIPAQPSHIVDTEKPRINALRITSKAGDDNTYKAADVIEVTVDWSKSVDVTGSPTIALSMEREIRTLAYKEGSGSNALVFSYTVTAGDTDETGIGIQAGQIALGNGTTITQTGQTTAAILTHSGLSDDTSHKVDTTAPKIVSNGVKITSTGAPYTATEVIQATVTFSENVLVTGTPQLALQIGSATKDADYTSGTGTTALLFEYTVVAGEADADGLSIAADALTLNSGTIKDAAGNTATLTHTALSNAPAHKVDSIKPTIATNGIAITSTPTSNSTYTKDDVIQTTVTFSENVDVTGTPQLALRIGTADKNADYTSGNGTTALVFEYTVVASDVDADGIEIRADKLTLNSGTIKDAAGNAATLTYNALTAQTSHKVDGTTPAINGIAITSTPTSNNTYKTGDKIQATVTFTENMKVTGTPQLELQIGSATKDADYASGTGTAALVFEYTVADGDTDADGISIAADALTLNSGTIKDTAGNNAVLTHAEVSVNASHKVDAVQPTLNSVEITSSAGDDATYMLGNVIQISMTMSEVVNVTGTPKLTLTIGTQNRLADYQSGGGTATLEFAYTVVASDMDTDGISIPNVPFNLNGASITDTVGNPLPDAPVPNQPAITDQIAHKVDTDPPRIVSSSSDDQGASGVVEFARTLDAVVVSNGVEITSSGPYGTGDDVQITVTFSESVRITGTPEIQLQIGGTTKNAAYQSGTTTDEITFTYIIVSGDADVDGISIHANSIQLNGGSITDIPGNSADLNHSEVNAASLHIVDTTLLKISSLAFSSTGPYKTSDNIEVTVATTKRVTVTGDVTLKVMIGNTEKSAQYHSGSGTNRLTFRYTVTPGDNDTNGVSVILNSLALNGGTIRDELGRNLDLNHDTLPDAGNPQRVDTTPPQVSSVVFTSTGPYGVGSDIEITLTTSEAVEVIGTPTLGMTIGTTQRIARFFGGNGTSALVFRYEITAADEDDADGVSVNPNSLSRNSGTITDSIGNALNLNHSGIANAGATQIVRTTVPSIRSLAFISTGPYGTSDRIEIIVATTKPVTVTGSATLKVLIGNTEKPARFHSGSGTNTLVFQYTVVSGDGDDTNGVSVRANSLSLNGGTIVDEFGTALNLNHDGLPDGGDSQRVDTTVPQVRSLAFTTTGPYSISDNIEVTLTTSEAVEVTGTPTLGIAIGTTQRAARFLGGTGTSTLVFRYEVTAADGDDANGVSVRANSLSLNGGTIVDALSTALNLSHNALPDGGDSQRVDTTSPQVSSLVFKSTGPYGVGNNIEITLTTSETVEVIGTPTLGVVIGTTERAARFFGGTGTSTLVFRYEVTAADEDDANGVSVRANSLSLNGGTITDTVGNDLNLNHTGIIDAGATQIVRMTIPSIRSLAFTSTGPYRISDNIEVTLTTTKSVTVTGSATLKVMIGHTEKPARYHSGSGTDRLVFQYTVVSGDGDDTNGVSVRANSLSLNGGTIADELGTALNLSHDALPDGGDSQRVDTTISEVRSLAFATTGPYSISDNIEITLTTSEAVEVTGTPTLGMTIGTTQRAARFFGGTGTSTLVFRYEVTTADGDDANGVSVSANSLSLNGGTIVDAMGTPLNLSHNALSDAGDSQRVDTTSPQVSSLAFTSTGPYGVGNNIEITLTTSETVEVIGTPTLEIIIGTTQRAARFFGGTGTSTLVFRYEITAADEDDADGVSVSANALTLNGGTITDTVGNALNLNHSGIANAGATQIVRMTIPSIRSLAFTTTGPYGISDNIEVTLTATKPVTVTGSATLKVMIGHTEKPARYHSGSGTDRLVFQYTVVPGDGDDTNGVSVRANSLSLNGGTIVDALGTALNLSHNALPDGGDSQRVDTTVPQVSSLAFTSTGPYGISDNIEVTLTTSKIVKVTGTPTLGIIIGTTQRAARFFGGTGTSTLVFRYEVTPTDGDDTNGVSVRANSLSLNGGTIVDALGTALNLSHNALPDRGERQRVDTTSPQVRSLAFTSTGPYGVGNNIEITLTTSEAVEVIGTPTLGITIGTTQRAARLFRGTGTSALVFRYEVTPTDEDDANGASVPTNSLSLNYGKITDSVGNNLDLNHTGIANAGDAQIVRTTIPSVRSLAFTSTGPYGISDNIEITVTTTKPVTVTGSATLKVLIGYTEKSARYHSGSGTNTIVFQYIVVPGDGDDTNGVSVRANSLSLNGGTIVDALGTALNLNHDGLPDAGEHQSVDTTLPEVSSLAFASTGPYSVGSDILVTATTSEAVTVTGRPTLIIVIGSTERTAHAYNSAGPTTLIFWYRITASDKDDTNGISVKANSLNLNGGTITDTVGNNLDLNHTGIANAGDAQIVGTTISDIRSLALTSTGPYAVEDTITVTAQTTEKVTVAGIPRIPMTLGTATKYANYISGSGTTSLVFQYTVVNGDEDADGVEIAQNALENHNGSKIENSYRTELNLNHPSVAADPKHKVDTSPPRIVDVDFSNDDAQTVYTAGSKIEVVVTFEDTDVQVKSTTGTDMPSVTLLFGDNSASDSRKTEVEAYYTESRPGSTILVFTYTVTADTPIDPDGIQIKSRSLKIPAGASIHDASGNAIHAIQGADGTSMVNIRVSTRAISRPILPAVTSTGIIFNEFLNADTNKEDWVELRNITDSEISIGGWELSLSTRLARGTNTFEFPEMTLPAGTVLLLVNTGHKETHLERSQAYTYRYLMVPELHLPASNFSLILRDKSKAIADVVGDYFGNTEGSDTPIVFDVNQAYFREQPNTPGYEATAWLESGYQGGLGYDRKTAKDRSLGTPGYLNKTLTQPSATVPVSISEIMFTPGKSERLPQWIEVYNGSKTEIVTLQGWRLQVEGYDPNNAPAHTFSTFIIQSPFQILPNQTALIITKEGRNSEHFPEQRIYNLPEQHPDKIQHLETDARLMPESGFAVVLRNNNGDQVDIVGNLDGQSGTRDEPSWKLPNCITQEGVRTSIIRQYEDGMPLAGNRKSSWFRATSIRRTIVTYWGHPKDIGNPGWKKGGALPVQLSSFSANRTEQGALIKWTTESELENAGFNVLRSDTKTGTFKVINPRMLLGAGTTSERHTYQYVDTTAKAGTAYYYRLEEVSFAGVSQPVATGRLRGHVSAANRYLTTLGSLKKME